MGAMSGISIEAEQGGCLTHLTPGTYDAARRYHPANPFHGELAHACLDGAPAFKLRMRQKERRSFILSEARTMIAECGTKGFNVRALAVKCEMSAQTVYNIVGGREDITRQAIEEHFEAVIRYAESRGELIEFFKIMAGVFFYWSRECPEYLRSLTMEYFRIIDPTFSTIHGSVIGAISKKLNSSPLCGGLLHSEVEEIACSIHAQMAFAAFEWSNFRFDEVEFEQRLVSCIRHFVVPLVQKYNALGSS